MREVRFALRQTVPIFFTYIFLGIAFGVMMTEAGYSAGWSVLCAVFIYAGSLQIVMVSLLQAGASLPAVAVMTFFVNARHIFYGVGFIERFRKMGWRYPYLVLALTDETYSILCSVRFEDGVDENRATFFIALFNQSYWVLGCLLGGLAGQMLPWDLTGIDFSATAFFLVVVGQPVPDPGGGGPGQRPGVFPAAGPGGVFDPGPGGQYAGPGGAEGHGPAQGGGAACSLRSGICFW